MIFFSPLANIDFPSFISLDLYSAKLHPLPLCCCRSSVTSRKALTTIKATYLLVLRQQRKHKSTKGCRIKMLWWLITSQNLPLLWCQQQNLTVVRLWLSRDLCPTLCLEVSFQRVVSSTCQSNLPIICKIF